MKKRILCFMMAVVACVGLCLGLVACGEKDNDPLSAFSTKFNTNNGSAIETQYGVIEIEPIPERSGYQFMGWFDNKSLDGERIEFPYTPDSDKVFYAAWQLTDEKAAVIQFFKDTYAHPSFNSSVKKITFSDGKYIYEREVYPTDNSEGVYQFIYNTKNDTFEIHGNWALVVTTRTARIYWTVSTHHIFTWGECNSGISVLNEVSYYLDQGANKDLLLVQTNLYTINTTSHSETSAKLKFTANTNNSYSRLSMYNMTSNQATEEDALQMVFDNSLKYANDFLYSEPLRI